MYHYQHIVRAYVFIVIYTSAKGICYSRIREGTALTQTTLQPFIPPQSTLYHGLFTSVHSCSIVSSYVGTMWCILLYTPSNYTATIDYAHIHLSIPRLAKVTCFHISDFLVQVIQLSKNKGKMLKEFCGLFSR